MNAALLNAVQTMVIEFANKNGVDLRTQFASVAEFKKFVIAFTIKALTTLGADANEAYDLVMGEGKFDELAASVWAACQ